MRFEKVVYLSHPYSALKENEDKVVEIFKELHNQYPNYLFISPIHAFSFVYDLVDYDTGLDYCLWLLDRCDEMWVFGGFEHSKGCMRELEYCLKNQKSFQIPIKKRGVWCF